MADVAEGQWLGGGVGDDVATLGATIDSLAAVLPLLRELANRMHAPNYADVLTVEDTHPE